MSPPPQGAVPVPLSGRSETKNSERPYTGVGQKSFATELMGSPRFFGGCHGEVRLSRSDTQMSLPTLPGTSFGRAEAKNRLSPSADSIGQPSGAAEFTSTTGVAVWKGEYCCSGAVALA